MNDNDIQSAVEGSFNADRTEFTFTETFYAGYTGEANVFHFVDKAGEELTFSANMQFAVDIAQANITNGTWSLFNERGGNLESLFTTQNGNILIIDEGKLFLSTDQGATGTEVTPAGLSGAGDICQAQDGILYVTQFLSTKIYSSADNGATWTQLATNLPGDPTIWDLEVDHDGVMYAAIYDFFGGPGPNNGIWTSADGVNWELKSTDLNNQNVREIILTGDGTLITGTDFPKGNIFRSTDGGASWVQITSPVTNPNSLRGGVALSSGEIYLATTSGMLRSTDDGETFTVMNTGLPVDESINLVCEVNGQVYVCPSNYGVFVLKDNQWKSVGLDLAPYNVTSMTLSGSAVLAAVTPNKVYKLD